MLSHLSSYRNYLIQLAIMLREPHLSMALRLTAMIRFHLLYSLHEGHRKAYARPVHASYQFQEIPFFFFFKVKSNWLGNCFSGSLTKGKIPQWQVGQQALQPCRKRNSFN